MRCTGKASGWLFCLHLTTNVPTVYFITEAWYTYTTHKFERPWGFNSCALTPQKSSGRQLPFFKKKSISWWMLKLGYCVKKPNLEYSWQETNTWICEYVSAVKNHSTGTECNLWRSFSVQMSSKWMGKIGFSYMKANFLPVSRNLWNKQRLHEHLPAGNIFY